MSSSSSISSDGGSPNRRYVFLVTPGEEPSPALLELLHRQGERPEEWIQADHPLIALAKIACLERDRRLQSRWYPDERIQNIFVVVNRDSWRDLEALFLTIQEHMRSVGIWVCTDGLAIEIHPGDRERDDAVHGDPSEDSNEHPPEDANEGLADGSNVGHAERPTAGEDDDAPPVSGDPLDIAPSSLDDPSAPTDGDDFSDDEDDLRVTEAEIRDLLDLYDANIPDPADESDDPEEERR